MDSGRPADEGRLLQLVYYGYVAASAVARALPERWIYRIAYFVGSFAAKRSKKRFQVALNLSRITGYDPGSPQISALVEEAFRSYARYWLETFRLVRETPEFFRERVLWLGLENMSRAVEAGGAIIVVGHLGNWDAAGASAGALGFRVVTVAEVLRPRRMFDFFAEHRRKLGMTIFPAQSGVTDQLADAAANGAVVAILGDRDLKGTGPEVRLFGEPINLPAGPAIVALKSGAAVLVAGVYNRTLADGSPGWVVDMGAPLDIPREHTDENVKEITEIVARELEAYIARSPADWHVFQPVWKKDLVSR